MEYLPLVFALLAAILYGSGDFAAGLGGRHIGSGEVALAIQAVGLVCVSLIILSFTKEHASSRALIWGSVAGASDAIGTLILYRGLAKGKMSVVAPLSAIISVVLPVMLGLAMGERWSAGVATGVICAIPAILLISLERTNALERGDTRRSVWTGLASGAGFACMFIAYDQAGAAAGAWPVWMAHVTSFILTLPFGWRVVRRPLPTAKTLWLISAAGFFGVIASIFFVAATGQGRLSVVAVLASLSPAFTVLLARMILKEDWTRAQVLGLLAALVSVMLISAG